MLQLLSGNPRTVDALGFLLAFALTALMDSVFHDKLPHDHGRAFAVNGELSKGKARGSGLIFVLCIALVTLAVVPFKAEYVIYTVLLIASMLSGYFDDAAETAWNEYKKGLIDLVIAVVAGVTYLNFNGTEVNFLSWSFSLPYAVYLILIIVLIWASINVVNCTDGVDGLSASLAVVSIGTFLLAYWEELGDYATAGIVFIGALLAYLWQNAKPSTLLMGDAGSRAMGFFLAVLALKSSHPFAFLQARAGYLPRLEGFAGYGARKSMFSPDVADEVHGWEVGVQAVWSLFDGALTRGKVIEARAQLEKARVETEDVVRGIQLEVRSACSTLVEAWEVLESQGKVLEQAHEALRLARVRAEAGSGTQLDVLGAQTALTQSGITQNRAKRDYAVARTRLERAIGAYAPELEARVEPAPNDSALP